MKLEDRHICVEVLCIHVICDVEYNSVGRTARRLAATAAPEGDVILTVRPPPHVYISSGRPAHPVGRSFESN